MTGVGESVRPVVGQEALNHQASTVDDGDDGALFDNTSDIECRDLHCQRDRLLPVFAFDHMVAAELFFGFCEGAIRDRRLPFLRRTLTAWELRSSFAPAT